MRLGLLGGTFDPIHRGHLQVACRAVAGGLDRVILIPARRPPHKERPDIADPFHRFALAALATVGQKHIHVSAFELMRAGPSFTIDTARHFLKATRDVTLIMGTDSLVELESWREGRRLVDLVHVVAYPRRPFLADRLSSELPDWVRVRLSSEPAGRAGSITLLEAVPDDTSSTIIRERIRKGLSIQELVPAAVEEYIVKNALYAPHEEHAD